MDLKPTCIAVKQNNLRNPRAGVLVGDYCLSGDSSSAWINVIEVVHSVPTNVIKVRMSWECHVSCEGSGLV